MPNSLAGPHPQRRGGRRCLPCRARAAGFANINLDFIFGLPDQDPATWARTLARAIDLAPEHLSLYSLTVEPGTPLFDQARRGVIAEPDDDLAADLYALACDALAAGGYAQYEISNWARTDERRTTNDESSSLRPSSFVLRLSSQPRLLAQRAVPRLRRGGAQLRGGAAVVERQAGAGVHPPDRRRAVSGTRG